MKHYIHNIAELISLLVAIFYYPYLKRSFMKWFLPFLAFIFLGELFAGYPFHGLMEENVTAQYVIGIAESIFYGYFFYHLYNRKSLQKLILFLVTISVAGYMIGLIFYRKNYHYFLPGLIISGFFLAAIALGYIYLKFVDDEKNVLIDEPGFWVALGVCLFFSGTSIVFSLYNFIVANNLNYNGLKLYNFVARILSVILYLSISIAIILCKKKTKISS